MKRNIVFIRMACYGYTLQLIFMNKPKTRQDTTSRAESRQEKAAQHTHNAPLIPCWFSFFWNLVSTFERNIGRSRCATRVSTAITFYFCASERVSERTRAHSHAHTFTHTYTLCKELLFNHGMYANWLTSESNRMPKAKQEKQKCVCVCACKWAKRQKTNYHASSNTWSFFSSKQIFIFFIFKSNVFNCSFWEIK